MSDSWREDDAANRVYFDAQFARWGLDARAADWGSRDRQYLRFAVLAGVDRLDGRRILDVGCGTGEFLHWLRERGVNPDYTGIDIAAAALQAAQNRFPDATFAELSVLDLKKKFLTPYDHVFASGVFTRRCREGRGFVETAVAAMFELALRSLSFNCLSTWATRAMPHEFHLDPAEAIAIGRRSTTLLTLRHDYHPADLTIHLYREGQRALTPEASNETASHSREKNRDQTSPG
jgi:SAM-dependent methyltransferase